MNKHLEEIEDFTKATKDSFFRYEITVTLNPKYIHSNDYAETMVPHIVNDVFKAGLRMSQHKGWYSDFEFNVVKEYQKNGMPHIHGTILTESPILPTKLMNTEQLFKRKYGKTVIWATGHRDHHHINDHFDGTWQEYLRKDDIPKYYRFTELFTNTFNPINFI